MTQEPQTDRFEWPAALRGCANGDHVRIATSGPHPYVWVAAPSRHRPAPTSIGRSRPESRSRWRWVASGLLACASTQNPSTTDRPSTSSTPVQRLRVFKGLQLTVQLTPDDKILDELGSPVGEFVTRSRVVRVDSVEVSLDNVVTARSVDEFALELPVGVWRIHIAPGGALMVNGEPWGHVEGFDAAASSWPRLEALFVALPLLPASARPPGP